MEEEGGNVSSIARTRPGRRSPSIPPTALSARIASGSVGAIATALAVTPLEVVKVRRQAAAQRGFGSTVSRCLECGNAFVMNNGLMECVLSKSSVPHFRGTVPLHSTRTSLPDSTRSGCDAAVGNRYRALPEGNVALLRHIFRTEGVRGIYAGLSPTLLMSVPNTVLYFTAYDEITSRLRAQQARLDRELSCPRSTGYMFDAVFVPLVGGSSSRLLASVCTSPLELIRTRQAMAGGETTFPQEVRNVIRSPEGLGTALTRGLAPTLWRDVPFSAIYWLCLETFRGALRKNYERRYDLGQSAANGVHSELPPMITALHAFLSGAASGMIAACCTTPFDVVKTRKQVSDIGVAEGVKPVSVRSIVSQSVSEPIFMVCSDHGTAEAVATGASYHGNGHTNQIRSGTFAHMRHIAETEGVAELWRGNMARMMKVAPACAIMISCYELGKNILNHE